MDWLALDGQWVPDKDDSSLPDEVHWTSSPCARLDRVLRDLGTSGGAAHLMASCELTLRQPTDERSITCVAELATSDGLSLAGAVEVMLELEAHGLVEWD